MNETLSNYPKKPQESLLELQFQESELEKIFEDENFSSEKLIALLEKQYPGVYKQDTDVWEGYTLKQHTLMVMEQFEKYFSDKTLPANINKDNFRLILALHDIGKPEAIAKEGKHFQHKYTQQYIQKLFGELKIDKKHTDLALALTSEDPIGKYIANKANAIDTKTAIENMAIEAGISTEDFFELLCIYYKSDAGSYTENAEGLRSLDDLFEFDEENRKLDFSSRVQNKIDQLGF
ncbi:MAG: hypothetical protein U9P70_03480 [Patescibacteria group bacterium]|nr:hypothetical protein [Patescibacteria group bacterium]